MLHPLLQRMLKRAALAERTPPTDPAAWRALLERVSRAFTEADQDRDLLERSLRVSADEIRQGERRYRDTFSRAPVGIAHVGRDGRIRRANERLSAITGYTEGELLLHRWADLTHAEDRAADQAQVDHLFAGAGGVTEIEERICRRDGAAVWVRTTRSLMPAGGGEDEYIISVVEDVTELHLARVLLEGQSEVLEMIAGSEPLEGVLARLATVIEGQMPGAMCSIMVADESCGVLRTLAAPSLPAPYCGVLSDGVPVGPGVGSCGTAAHERRRVIVEDVETDPLWKDYRAIALAHGLRACWSEPIVAGDGRVLGTFAIYYREARRPDARESGVIHSAAHLARVAIERRRAEEAMRRYTAELESAKAALERQAAELAAHAVDLRHARDAAESASRAKSVFLANMSHEIRTPMTAILGFADLLEAGDATPSQRAEWVRTIRRNGEHLLGILNDILDLSKIEAGRLTVERIESSPADLARQAVSLLRAEAERKGLAFGCEFDGALPRTTRTDPTRVRQVLVNLLGNAVKFTREGSVRLRVSLREDAPEGTPAIHFEVTDTGIGMTRDQVARIFQPFTQADDTTTRRFGGTGLGLTISRRLAHLLGGEIRVESTPGRGSRFTFVLPVSRGEAADAAPPCAADHGASRPAPTSEAGRLGSVRVLLAEDGIDNQRLIAALLRRWGAEVEIAGTGREAVDAALEGVRNGRAFDIILMDMQMPELDGYGATAMLRAAGYDRPIVALTAHAMTGDREKCLRAGCDDFLTKPIERTALLGACEHWAAVGREERSKRPRQDSNLRPPSSKPGALSG